MSRPSSIVSLSLLVIGTIGCERMPSAATGPDVAYSAQRLPGEPGVPFTTRRYRFNAIGTVPEPGCDAVGESRRYLAGDGSATHLGSYTVQLSFCARPGGILDDGLGTFVAANGDLLHLTFEGTSAFAPPFTLNFTSYALFTGGTGRFDGASGQAMVTGSLDVRTGAGDGAWEGMLSSIGSNKR
jgi:hypothetical protein